MSGEGGFLHRYNFALELRAIATPSADVPQSTPCCLSQFKLRIIFCATPRAAPGRTRTTPAKCRKKEFACLAHPSLLDGVPEPLPNDSFKADQKTERGGSREDRIRQASSSAQPPLVPIMPTKFFFFSPFPGQPTKPHACHSALRTASWQRTRWGSVPGCERLPRGTKATAYFSCFSLIARCVRSRRWRSRVGASPCSRASLFSRCGRRRVLSGRGAESALDVWALVRFASPIETGAWLGRPGC